MLAKTPPFIDAVTPDSPAARARLQPDDLILFINNAVVVSYESAVETLSLIDHIDPVRLTVQRGQQLVEVVLRDEGVACGGFSVSSVPLCFMRFGGAP